MPTPKKYKLAILVSHPIQYFSPLYRRLAQEPGIDLTVYYCSRQGLEEYVDSGFGIQVKWDVPLLEGYQYKFLPNLRREDHASGFFRFINPAIVQELRQGRFDALWVHGHSYATYLLAILAARVLQIPVLMRCETHLLLSRSIIKRALRRPLMTLFYKYLCRVCLPIGTRNAEFYRFHGVSDDRLFLVPYTVDNDLFRQATEKYREDIDSIKDELGLPKSMPVVLFVSKMQPRKRAIDLLRAYHRLRKQGTVAALVFVGSGSEEVALKDYVELHHVPDVYFFGFQNQSELPKFYAMADVFVLPSENEPWGLIINEVMCAGLPMVASEEIGAVADLVHYGENGFTFRAGDIDVLTGHLRILVNDANLRDRMGENSLKIIVKWDFERCVEGISQALSKVASAKR